MEIMDRREINFCFIAVASFRVNELESMLVAFVFCQNNFSIYWKGYHLIFGFYKKLLYKIKKEFQNCLFIELISWNACDMLITQYFI